MSRKDFEMIADIISAVRAETDGTVDGILNNLATKFANVLGGTNPRFDRDRFMGACGF